MLSQIEGERKRRRFLVYDLEWVPGTMQLRLFGVFDGLTYRWYRTVEQFIANELTSKNRNRWFYAHAGGLADLTFLLETFTEKLSDKGFSIKCAFSGSSAIIVQVTRGKNSWTFVDSYWLLRDKLENIAKWIGEEKGEAEKRQTQEEAKQFYATADEHTLMVYNRGDCEILWLAIDEMQDVLWRLGGQLQKTLASSAMHLFRRNFLSKDIRTAWSLNERATKAYFASRVEVFAEHAWHAEYYDINSSFPYAMTFPCPGEFLGTSKTIVDDGIYLADVTMEVPECFLPPIPARIKGRLFFPCGKWRSWLTSVDVELLQKQGGKICKVWKVLHFAPFTDLANYATTLYNLRKQAKTPFEKTAFKLLLNSLYGKFAESPQKTAIHINPPKTGGTLKYLYPGVWYSERIIPIPHRHVPVSAHITAIARRTIFEFMDECQDIHYCDTDGFSTTSHFDTSTELGGLKLEKQLRYGRFVQPKVYRLDGKELTKDGWKELGNKGVKAKGFSDMTIEKFGKLLEGDAIAHERMRRIKEQARRGQFKAEEHVIMKRLTRNALSKRFHYPDGTTRPWMVKELRDYFIGNRRY